jgi:hypothetical protein
MMNKNVKIKVLACFLVLMLPLVSQAMFCGCVMVIPEIKNPYTGVTVSSGGLIGVFWESETNCGDAEAIDSAEYVVLTNDGDMYGGAISPSSAFGMCN